MTEPRKLTSHTAMQTPGQAEGLRTILVEQGFTFEEKPYTLFAGSKPGLNVSVYEKGPKVLVQGKGTRDFVEFVLEPQVLGAPGIGYEEVLSPEQFESHIGIDESGKGDFFGPLVIAAVHTDRDSAKALMSLGVQDSKRITSDARIRDLADGIRELTHGNFSTIQIQPARYNELYTKMGNVNTMLGWGHARALENVLARVPNCSRAVSDKFADDRVIKKALLERGRGIELVQRTKAESDVAVAAASILARESFIDWHAKTARSLGRALPRGASDVKGAARALVAEHGAPVLREYAKTHFRTAWEVAPGEFPEPPPRRPWRKSGV